MKFRIIKKLKGLPIGLSVMIAFALVVMGALITWYGTYNTSWEGDLTVNGQEPFLLIDGAGVVQQTATFSIDTTEIDGGETIVESHTVKNQNTKARVLTWDLSSVTFTEPSHEFYGYECHILDDTDTEVDKLVVDVGNTDTFKIQHSLHPDFMHTTNPLSFVLGMDITVSELYGMTGLWVYKNINDAQLVYIDEFNTDSLLEVWDIDETTLQASVTYPSSAGDWNITVNTMDSINYADSHESTNCISFDMLTTEEQEWLALIPDTTLGLGTTDIVIENTFGFATNTEDVQVGHVFNYVDSDNYWYCYLNTDTDQVFLNQVDEGTDTNMDSAVVSLTDGEDYILKTELDLFDDTIRVSVDGSLKIEYEVI